MKIKEAVDEWTEWLYFTGCEDSTVRKYEVLLTGWFKANSLMDYDVKLLDRKMLDSYINSKDRVGLATRRLKLHILKSFCKFCQGEGYNLKNPALLMKIRMKELTHKQKEAKERIPYSHEEYETLINGFNKYLTTAKGFNNLQRKPRCRFWRTASIISYWTGLRFGDVCNLERDSFSGNSLIVWTDKRDKRVDLPLTPDYMGDGIVIDELNKILSEKPHYFPDEREIYNNLHTQCSLFKSFKRWSDGIGLEGRTFHCLRHSFVTRLHDDGVSLLDIGKLVGHANEKTTDGYCHSKKS